MGNTQGRRTLRHTRTTRHLRPRKHTHPHRRQQSIPAHTLRLHMGPANQQRISTRNQTRHQSRRHRNQHRQTPTGKHHRRCLQRTRHTRPLTNNHQQSTPKPATRHLRRERTKICNPINTTPSHTSAQHTPTKEKTHNGSPKQQHASGFFCQNVCQFLSYSWQNVTLWHGICKR